MNRRSLLALLAGGSATLAGCSFADDADPSVTPAALDDDTASAPDAPRTTADEEPPETDDEASPPDRPLGAANVGSLAAGERRVAFPFRYRSDDAARVELELIREATADGPLTLRATLTNANPWTNTFRLRWLPPFGSPYGQPPVDAFGRRLTVARERGYDTALAFAPTTDDGLASDVPALERDEEGYWRLAETGTWLPETVELDADESVSETFALVGHPEGTGRPTGTYRWARPGDAVAVHVWDGASPGPHDPSRFDGASVPDLPRDGPTYWFHEADAGTTAFLRPSAERVATPARLDVAMHNHGPTPLGGNTYDYALYKLAGGEWFHLGPYVVNEPYTSVPPGGTDTWTFGLFAGDAPDFEGSREFGHLGGGRYAVRVNYSRLDEAGDERGGVHAALFDLDAPTLDVTPTDDTAVVEAGEGRVVVRSDRHLDTGEHREQATLTLAVDGASEDGPADPVVAEQAMRPRFRGLRNTLGYVDDDALADRAGTDDYRVVLRTDDRTSQQVLGYDRESRRLSFGGQRYELTTTEE